VLAGLVAAAAMPVRAQVSDDLVKLGVLTDMASLYADGTGIGSVEAARMAIDDFGGKVLGRPVQLVYADHQNKADVGSNIARQWYDQEKVDAIIDVPTSSIALAVQQITRDKNRVFLISGGGSSDLTGSACSPNGVHWTYDTYALSKGTAQALVKQGQDTWFFITADYAFGHALERDASEEVKRNGGKVLGSVRHPLNTSDFSSFLLQAQASKAKVVAFANAGGDTSNGIKQAAEFGLTQGGQTMAALLLNITDAHSLGLNVGQGLVLTDGFYWDMDDQTRAFSKRFFDRVKHMPTQIQAGVYSAVTTYLKAIKASGTDEALKVIARIRETPINDVFARNGRLREDGRMIHDMYLMRLKKPSASKSDWDLYDIVAKIPAEEAFRPLSEGGCPLVKQ
jgi:branched-chain amino acid transport system substrate-binding protein